MSAREVLRGARLVLHAERPPGAPEATYEAACLLCRHGSGPAHSERKPVAVWAMEHTRRHGLPHSQFLVTTQSHWRVDPLPSSPHKPAPAPRPRPRPRSHARPRTWAVAEPLALVALLLVSASVLFGVGASLVS